MLSWAKLREVGDTFGQVRAKWGEVGDKLRQLALSWAKKSQHRGQKTNKKANIEPRMPKMEPINPKMNWGVGTNPARWRIRPSPLGNVQEGPET